MHFLKQEGSNRQNHGRESEGNKEEISTAGDEIMATMVRMLSVLQGNNESLSQYQDKSRKQQVLGEM